MPLGGKHTAGRPGTPRGTLARLLPRGRTPHQQGQVLLTDRGNGPTLSPGRLVLCKTERVGTGCLPSLNACWSVSAYCPRSLWLAPLCTRKRTMPTHVLRSSGGVPIASVPTHQGGPSGQVALHAHPWRSRLAHYRRAPVRRQRTSRLQHDARPGMAPPPMVTGLTHDRRHLGWSRVWRLSVMRWVLGLFLLVSHCTSASSLGRMVC